MDVVTKLCGIEKTLNHIETLYGEAYNLLCEAYNPTLEVRGHLNLDVDIYVAIRRSYFSLEEMALIFDVSKEYLSKWIEDNVDSFPFDSKQLGELNKIDACKVYKKVLQGANNNTIACSLDSFSFQNASRLDFYIKRRFELCPRFVVIDVSEVYRKLSEDKTCYLNRKRSKGIDVTKYLAMIDVGMSDDEIAKAFNITKTALRAWRYYNRNNLPPEAFRKQRASRRESPELFKLYCEYAKQGLTLNEIAERLNVPLQRIYNLRRYNKQQLEELDLYTLGPRPFEPRTHKPKIVFTKEMYDAFVQEGLSRKQMAERLNCSVSTIYGKLREFR